MSLDHCASVRRNTWPQVRAFFRDGTSDGRALHLTLGIYDNTGIILKVEEKTVTSTPSFALADNDGRHRLLAKFWLSLLHGRHNHVTDTGIRKTIQMRAKTEGFYDKERLCAAVVCTVEDGTDGQTEGQPEFVASSSRAALGHFVS
jgi:hypothetical protein